MAAAQSARIHGSAACLGLLPAAHAQAPLAVIIPRSGVPFATERAIPLCGKPAGAAFLTAPALRHDMN